MANLKHVFMITAHKEPDLLLKIMMLLSSEHHYFIVNIDSKMADHKAIASKIKHIVPNSTFLFKRISHGGFSQVATTLKMLQIAKQFDPDYCHLLSGQDYPVKTISEFDQFFECHNGESFMWFDTKEQHEKWSISKYKERVDMLHFNDMPFKNLPIVTKLYAYCFRLLNKMVVRKKINELRAGWNWFSWHKNVINFVLQQYDCNKSFFNRFHYTHCCDEIIFHTLLYPHISKLKIHADIPLRYINWDKRAPGRSSNYSPLILNEEELAEIERPNIFFCRKVDPLISKYLIEHLTNNIRQK